MHILSTVLLLFAPTSIASSILHLPPSLPQASTLPIPASIISIPSNTSQILKSWPRVPYTLQILGTLKFELDEIDLDAEVSRIDTLDAIIALRDWSLSEGASDETVARFDVVAEPIELSFDPGDVVVTRREMAAVMDQIWACTYAGGVAEILGFLRKGSGAEATFGMLELDLQEDVRR